MTTGALAGKAAFVTGGSRGIGAAIARKLAREGASVALTYVNSADQAQAVVSEIERAAAPLPFGPITATQKASNAPFAMQPRPWAGWTYW